MPTIPELEARIAEVEESIQTADNDLDAARQAARAKLLELNAQRDKLATALRALRAGLPDYAGQVLGVSGMGSTAGVGTPGV